MRTSSGTDGVDRTVVETTRFAIYVHIVSVKRYSSVVFGAEVLEKARVYHGQVVTFRAPFSSTKKTVFASPRPLAVTKFLYDRPAKTLWRYFLTKSKR